MDGRPTLADLEAFAAVAGHRSFRKAADALGLSPSSLSHRMRALEERLGVRLLHRTTRSVSPTEAGAALLDRVRPVLSELDGAIDALGDFGAPPAGTLRINADEGAARVLLAHAVPAFLARFPAVTVDLVTEGRLVDIVAGEFDAGVRLGEAVPLDMVAVRFGGAARFVAVASPSYLDRHGAPVAPSDLAQHSCIRVRMPSGKPYRWEFARDGRNLALDVPGPLVLDHAGLMVEAAAAGLGIAYVAERWAAPLVAAGALVILLEDWCPPIPGLCLYYPGHRRVPAALRAFVDILRTA